MGMWHMFVQLYRLIVNRHTTLRSAHEDVLVAKVGPTGTGPHRKVSNPIVVVDLRFV